MNILTRDQLNGIRGGTNLAAGVHPGLQPNANENASGSFNNLRHFFIRNIPPNMDVNAGFRAGNTHAVGGAELSGAG